MSASQTTPARDAVPPPGDSSTHTLSAAYESLKPWLDLGATDDLEALGPAAVYKTSAVLWRMLFQRLNPRDQSARRGAALRRDRAAGAENPQAAARRPALDRHRRLPRRPAAVDPGDRCRFEEQVATAIIQSTPPAFGSRRVFLSGLRRTWGPDDHPRADAGAATGISPGVEPAWRQRVARGLDRDRACAEFRGRGPAGTRGDVRAGGGRGDAVVCAPVDPDAGG